MKKEMEIPVVLIIATVMSIIGSVILPHALDRSFHFYELIIPSCLTWLLLFPLLREASIGLTIAVGFLSPFIGGVLYSIQLAIVEGKMGWLFLGPLFLLPFIQDTWQVTIPVGIVTAFLSIRVLDRGLRIHDHENTLNHATCAPNHSFERTSPRPLAGARRLRLAAQFGRSAFSALKEMEWISGAFSR